ncbi:MAG: phage late control D family protein [Oscillospiraceae bacterium]|nr:phage late control D family protein [Oscillospiraceae bacterium]
MRFINDGNFKVSPFEFDSIEELRIERRLNEHATLYIKGVVKPLWKDMPVMVFNEGTKVKCEDDDNVYFCGVLQDVVSTSVDDVYYLEVSAISHTIKLDTKKYKRSFQDTGWTYNDIVSAIVGEDGGSVSFNVAAKNVAKVLVQYAETDWQFAKRLASHSQDVLMSISSSDAPMFHFGVEDGSCAGEIETKNFSVFKDFNLLRARSNDDNPLSEDSVLMYKVKTDDFGYGMFDVGEKVRFNKKDMYVRYALLTLEKSVIFCQYILSSKKAITAPKTYNRNITGLALAGIVQVVENDDVKLDLHIDYRPGTNQFFKYATDYSPESHTGWYVMPEVGDTVFLVFPTEDEKDAHASSSMRQSGTGKTGDPLVKFLRTPFGKEIKLEEKEILITAKDDATYIRLHEDKGIEIHTEKPIEIFSNETLHIESTGDMRIDAKSNLTIEVTNNMEIIAGDSIKVTCQNNVVEIEPPTGIAATTDQELNLLSKNDTNIESKTNLSVTTGNKTNIDATESFTVMNKGNSMNFDPRIGITLATDKLQNFVSRLNTTIASGTNTAITSGLNSSIEAGINMTLNSRNKMKLDGGNKLEGSANAGLNMSTKSGSALKLAAQGVDLKGTVIKEN